MRRLLIPAVALLGVTAVAYATAQAHTPDYLTSLFGRTGEDAAALKAWLASAVVVLALGQLTLALWMYRRLPRAGAAPRQVAVLHRVGGVTVFALTLPVAFHCYRAYGFQLATPRQAVHSFAGVFFYGAFAAKVLVVRDRRLPGWALPVAGGLLLTVIAALWTSSALWFLTR